MTRFGRVIRTVNPDGSEQRVIYGYSITLMILPQSARHRKVLAHSLGNLHLRRQ